MVTGEGKGDGDELAQGQTSTEPRFLTTDTPSTNTATAQITDRSVLNHRGFTIALPFALGADCLLEIPAFKMSINLTVTLPVDTVAALQQAATPGVDRTNMSDAMNKAVRAVLEAAGGLPYQLVSKTSDPGPPMRLVVQTCVGKLITIHILRSTTMAGIAELLSASERIPPSQQRLVYNGEQVFNGDTCDSESERTAEEVGNYIFMDEKVCRAHFIA